MKLFDWWRALKAHPVYLRERGQWGKSNPYYETLRRFSPLVMRDRHVPRAGISVAIPLPRKSSNCYFLLVVASCTKSARHASIQAAGTGESA